MTAEVIDLRRRRRLTRSRWFYAIVSSASPEPFDHQAALPCLVPSVDARLLAKPTRSKRRSPPEQKTAVSPAEREYRRWLKEQERRQAEAYERHTWGCKGKKVLIPGKGYADPSWRTATQRAPKIAAARSRPPCASAEPATALSWWRLLFGGS